MYYIQNTQFPIPSFETQKFFQTIANPAISGSAHVNLDVYKRQGEGLHAFLQSADILATLMYQEFAVWWIGLLGTGENDANRL